MAHVVGVPRRDPCGKCHLPVFLAERLTVGKKVYHRTCLKCARCGTQLSPGSFYETEVDEQYCCETCPDEEITMDPAGVEFSSNAAAVGGLDTSLDPDVELRNQFERDNNARSPSTIATTSTRSVRSSIKDRLAFFEQQQQQLPTADGMDSKLLQKSLSDEEKTQSLHRGERLVNDNHPGYRMNSALSSFMYDTVDNEPDDGKEDDDSESLASLKQNPKLDSSDSETTDDLKSSTQTPELPKSLPPLQEPDKPKEIKSDTKRFTASAQLVLGTTTLETPEALADDHENVVRTISPEEHSHELELSLNSSSNSYDKTNNNMHADDDDAQQSPAMSQDMEMHETPRNVTQTIRKQLELEDNLECNKINDNDCVTKEKATEEVSMEMDADAVATQQLEESTNERQDNVVTKSLESTAEVQNDTSDPDVELRTKSLPTESREVHPNTGGDDVATTQRLSVVRARLQQFEVITSNEKEKDTTKKQATATGTATDINEEVCKDLHENLPNTLPLNGNETISRQELEIETSLKVTQTQDVEIETQREVDLSKKQEIDQASEVLKTNENQSSLKDIDPEVPLTTVETKDNDDEEELLENKTEINGTMQQQEKEEQEDLQKTNEKSPTKLTLEEYPEDLNPFKSDDEEEEENKENVVELRKPPKRPQTTPRVISVNPFDSSDDEIELEKIQSSRKSVVGTHKIPPPRPPPPRISRNPFGSDDDEEEGTQSFSRRSSLTASQNMRTPVPTPRSNLSQSQNSTPEPTPRLGIKAQASTTTNVHHQHLQHTGNSIINSATTTPHSNSYVLQNSSDFYGSANSLHSNNAQTPNNLLRNSDTRSSNNSLNLSAGGTIRSRKARRAPLPPPAPVKELFPSSETVNSSSKASTPSSSTMGTPKSGRKKRPAPAPPKPARLEPAAIPQIQVDTVTTQPKNLLNYPLQSELDSKLSDEEKALLEGKTSQSPLHVTDSDITLSPASRRSSKRLIPLDKELLEEHLASQCDDSKRQQNLQKSISQQEAEETIVVYRRLIIPHGVDTPTHESNPLLDELNQQLPTMGERQLEKLKDNKEANNRNRQSQISAASSGAEDNDPLFNKSVHGKWKRRKGPAPALPIPPRKVLLMLPLQEIKHELEIIEVQQQGLEKQGVVLEKMIRDRCENQNGEPLSMGGAATESTSATCGETPPTTTTTTTDSSSPLVENSKEVENLILQLFELVNEKNELFRRQAELMYLRRQHRLEQEQADLEYEIRVLMAQPERNKTDTDKTREEALIERLVEVVQLRNEVVECLEMDRIREAEEDLSIKLRLESHIAQREEHQQPETKSKSSTLSKLSKKEKKKQKEAKKMGKSKKLDADKDADESEMSTDKQKTKKKKKLLIF